jgi:hypothetical protein
VLIVFLLYFPAIDANNSGEEEEVDWTRSLFILLVFLFDGVEEVQGQISQPRQAIFFDPLLSSPCCDLLFFWYLVLACTLGLFSSPLLHTCLQV